MLIAEVAKQFELTPDTLRYYEKEGLIGPIQKGKNGIRNYQEEDLKRISFVKCMRSAGVEISFLRKYMQLFDQGNETLEERKTILIEQRKIIKQKLEVMQQAYERLNLKIDLYDQKLLEKGMENS